MALQRHKCGRAGSRRRHRRTGGRPCRQGHQRAVDTLPAAMVGGITMATDPRSGRVPSNSAVATCWRLWAPISDSVTRRYGATEPVLPGCYPCYRRIDSGGAPLGGRVRPARPRVTTGSATTGSEGFAEPGGRRPVGRGVPPFRPRLSAMSRATLSPSRAGSSGWQGRRASRSRLPAGRRCRARSPRGRP